MLTGENEIVFGVFIAAVILMLLASLVVLLVWQYMRVRMQKEREILKAVFDTQEKERNRISEDLHDDIGARLSALKLQNELLIAGNIAEEGNDIAVKNSRQIDSIVRELRKIVRNQASKYIRENGLHEELEALCAQYSGTGKLIVSYNFNTPAFILSEEFSVSLFRILQELLNNTIKHANAQEVKIDFNYGAEYLEVKYSDNGNGMENTGGNAEGMGLKNIRTRAGLYKGLLQIESSEKGIVFTLKFHKKNILAAPVEEF